MIMTNTLEADATIAPPFTTAASSERIDRVAEALAVAAEHGGTIDLLVTDVIMPRILGPDLAIRLARVRPGLRVLFTSGYTAGGTGLTAMLPPDARFIDKPFSPGDLVAAVRAALDDTSLPLTG